MKKARTVEVEEGQTLSTKDFDKLHSHARNSAIWYATNYSKTTKEIREKLYRKGYPKGTVFVEDNEGNKREVNMVEEAITHLVDSLYVDDALYAERFAESKRNRGFGASRVKSELFFKGIPEDVIEDVLERIYEDSDDELYEFLEKQVVRERKNAKDLWALRRKVTTRAVGKGWGFEEINRVLERILTDEEDEE